MSGAPWTWLVVGAALSSLTTVPAHHLMVYLDRLNIRSYDLHTRTSAVLAPSFFRNAIAMDFDMEAQKLYVSDVVVKALYEVDISTTPPRLEVILEEGLGVPDGLAFDYVNKKLYWTDAGEDVKFYMRLKKRFLKIFL